MKKLTSGILVLVILMGCTPEAGNRIVVKNGQYRVVIDVDESDPAVTIDPNWLEPADPHLPPQAIGLSIKTTEGSLFSCEGSSIHYAFAGSDYLGWSIDPERQIAVRSFESESLNIDYLFSGLHLCDTSDQPVSTWAKYQIIYWPLADFGKTGGEIKSDWIKISGKLRDELDHYVNGYKRRNARTN